MSDLSERTILVVDDEQDLREMVAFEFELRGTKVFAASNGLSALGIVDSQPVDAIVTDIRMSGCDGIELLNNLRTRSALPAISEVIVRFEVISLWGHGLLVFKGERSIFAFVFCA